MGDLRPYRQHAALCHHIINHTTKSDAPHSLTDGLQTVSYLQTREGTIAPVKGDGWPPVTDVNRQAWREIERKSTLARKKVASGQFSCLYYHMTVQQMNILLLARSNGQAPWKVLLHLIPFFFRRLTTATLQNYADLFQVTPDDLRKGRISSAPDTTP